MKKLVKLVRKQPSCSRQPKYLHREINRPELYTPDKRFLSVSRTGKEASQPKQTTQKNYFAKHKQGAD